MLGYRYMSKIKPRLKCPIKAGIYNVDDVDIFFGILLEMPVEGFRWILRFSLVGKPITEKGGLMTIGCFSMNARVLASTARKRVVKAKDVVLT